MVSVEYDGVDVSRATETGTVRSCTLLTQLTVCQKGTMTTTLELNQGIRCTLFSDAARHVQVQSEAKLRGNSLDDQFSPETMPNNRHSFSAWKKRFPIDPDFPASICACRVSAPRAHHAGHCRSSRSSTGSYSE